MVWTIQRLPLAYNALLLAYTLQKIEDIYFFHGKTQGNPGFFYHFAFIHTMASSLFSAHSVII